MKKYSTKSLSQFSLKEITALINKTFQQKFQGKTVFNKDRKINIAINRSSRKKTREIKNKETAVVVLDLITAIENAVFINFDKQLKEKHHKKFPSAIAFLNFNYNCFVDGKKKKFKLSIIQTKNLLFRFHYSLHEHVWSKEIVPVHGTKPRPKKRPKRGTNQK